MSEYRDDQTAQYRAEAEACRAEAHDLKKRLFILQSELNDARKVRRATWIRDAWQRALFAGGIAMVLAALFGLVLWASILPDRGEAGARCYENNTCNDDLTCVSERCATKERCR